jgi:BirA family biotin operon repressor/biotin-[acetyl-CoA-carboxylase] ligase
MPHASESFTQAGLDAALVGHPFIRRVVYHPQVGSTNDLAKAYAGEGAAEGLLLIADEQSAGRGRMGRHWWSPSGSALLTALLFRPALPPEKAQQLTMLCALAAADAVNKLTALPADLKWPNDLLIAGRKLAGLLTTSAIVGDSLEHVIVGMGLNVNTDWTNAPPLITPATSLRQELGRPVDRLALLVAYLDGVARRYAQLAQQSPYDEWASRLVTLGQFVTARHTAPASPWEGNQTISGLAQGVDASGALLLRTAQGTIQRLFAADVSLSKQSLDF